MKQEKFVKLDYLLRYANNDVTDKFRIWSYIFHQVFFKFKDFQIRVISKSKWKWRIAKPSLKQHQPPFYMNCHFKFASNIFGVKCVNLVTANGFYDRKTYWKVKNCFQISFMNDGEFINLS